MNAKPQTQAEWRANDELFFRQLRAGHAWQHLPAIYLRCHGFDVELPDLTVRKDIADAGKWTDADVDMRVDGWAIEIKSRGLDFTSAADFPHAMALVDTVSGYNAKLPKPVAYVFVSQVTGAMLALNTEREAAFRVVDRFDRIRQFTDKFYVCPRELLKPMNVLVAHLHRLGR